jgi:two-component system phosphate regulon sensor histidine kinase PhoR
MSGDLQQRVRIAAALLAGGFALSILILLLLHRLTGSSLPLEPWLICTTLATIAMLVVWRAYVLAIRDSEIVAGMTTTARQIARGDLDRKIDAEPIPVAELRELAEAINAVAARVKIDIGEMKRLERMRSEFLGNVSHELRTPIFSVQGYLETLIDGAVDDPSVRDDFLKKAHHNVLRLHNLLTDLIEISRIESGEMKMSFRYFDAAGYFGAVIEELRPTAEMAGISLSFNVVNGDGDTTVFGDRDRLKQALVNLVENAIKYNRPDGRVDVELEFRDDRAFVRVRDTGIGIPESDLGRIFERFYRVDKDRARAVGGSGLGLSITKHIIEAHRSKINVESELGVGTTFSFSLKR